MTHTIAGIEQLDAPNARPFHHIAGFDGIRAVAVLLVVGLHFGSLWRDVRDGGLLPGGYVGVDIFFVLSGFLITTLLVSEKSATGGLGFSKFYARRALRLLPALYVVLIAHFLYTVWIGGSLVTESKEILAVVFYVANYAQVYALEEMINSGIGMTWSLAIEEQFYLVWPAVLVLGILRFAKTRNTVLWVIGAGVVASAVIRFLVWNFGGGYPEAYMRPECRADGLLIGAFCAFLWRWRMVPTRGLRQLALVSAAFLAVAAVFLKSGDFVFNGGFTLLSLAAGVVILAVAMGDELFVRPMEWAPLRAIGKVSYAAYLWHGLALRIAVEALDTPNRVVNALAGLAIAAIAVSASWVFVEQPFLRLKRKVASPVAH